MIIVGELDIMRRNQENDWRKAENISIGLRPSVFTKIPLKTAEITSVAKYADAIQERSSGVTSKGDSSDFRYSMAGATHPNMKPKDKLTIAPETEYQFEKNYI